MIITVCNDVNSNMTITVIIQDIIILLYILGDSEGQRNSLVYDFTTNIRKKLIKTLARKRFLIEVRPTECLALVSAPTVK